jgi:translation initiation factor IF-3
VRLIGEAAGEQFGVVPLEEARQMADERGLDLVLISATAVPPVCKMINFGKFKYEQSKKEKDAKKQSKAAQQGLKEVKMSPRIEDHDYDFKLKHAREFLSKGNKVKISIIFKGREMHHPELGQKLVQQIITDLADVAKADNRPDMQNRILVLVVSPLK